MPEYDNTNRGVLFTNDKTAETQPDYSGTINVAGKEYRIAGWAKLSKAGKKFLSLSVSEPRDQYDQRPAHETAPKQDINTDDPINLDDIPF